MWRQAEQNESWIEEAVHKPSEQPLRDFPIDISKQNVLNELKSAASQLEGVTVIFTGAQTSKFSEYLEYLKRKFPKIDNVIKKNTLLAQLPQDLKNVVDVYLSYAGLRESDSPVNQEVMDKIVGVIQRSLEQSQPEQSAPFEYEIKVIKSPYYAQMGDGNYPPMGDYSHLAVVMVLTDRMVKWLKEAYGVSDSDLQTNHFGDVSPNVLAWVRIASPEPNKWIVIEVESDIVSKLSRAKSKAYPLVSNWMPTLMKEVERLARQNNVQNLYMLTGQQQVDEQKLGHETLNTESVLRKAKHDITINADELQKIMGELGVTRLSEGVLEDYIKKNMTKYDVVTKHMLDNYEDFMEDASDINPIMIEANVGQEVLFSGKKKYRPLYERVLEQYVENQHPRNDEDRERIKQNALGRPESTLWPMIRMMPEFRKEVEQQTPSEDAIQHGNNPEWIKNNYDEFVKLRNYYYSNLIRRSLMEDAPLPKEIQQYMYENSRSAKAYDVYGKQYSKGLEPVRFDWVRPEEYENKFQEMYRIYNVCTRLVKLANALDRSCQFELADVMDAVCSKIMLDK